MARQSTLNGAENVKANANIWTIGLGRKIGLQQEGNTATPHVDLRNRFEVLQAEKVLLQDQRTTNVEEVVACTPDVLLNNTHLRQENVMSSPSSIGKSGSIGLRAMKEWLRNGRCHESSSTTSEFQKPQVSCRESNEAPVRVPVKFVRSKSSERGTLGMGCKFSQQALTRLTDLCHEEALGLRVYVIIGERNKLLKLGFSFDLMDLEVSASNMARISSSIEVKAHKYFNSLPVTLSGDKWMSMWMNAGMICGSFNDACIKKQLLLCLEEKVDSLDEVLHFHEEELEEDIRQDVVLGWEKINEGGWAWTQGEGLCPSWETSQLCS